MSSVTSQFVECQNICTHLQPISLIAGNPEDILELTHDELIEFHKTHYHPSNAIFLTSGNLNPKEIQSYNEENVLTQFSPLKKKYLLIMRLVTSPKIASEVYTHSQVMKKSFCVQEKAINHKSCWKHICSHPLLDNSASPLKKS